jgi:hypothetical protein
MLVDLSKNFKVEKLIDGQIANSLLSGIIEETAQFSNHKTTSETMAAGSRLLEAGANQQLVSKEVLSGNTVEVEIPAKPSAVPENAPADVSPPPTPSPDDAFRIEHPVSEPDNSVVEEPKKVIEQPLPKLPEDKISSTDNQGDEASENIEENDYQMPDVSGDIDQIAIAPIMNTPMMTHQSLVMGQSSAPKPAAEKSNSPPVLAPTPPVNPSPTSPLQPVEALNAQSVDLTKDNNVEVPKIELEHPAQTEADIDYGAGSNIEFSEPVSPPPVPPPIITT